MRKYSKIGILGGSFNPIHLGHAAVAQMAAEELNLDIVLFVPARVNPLKGFLKDVTPFQRCAMTKDAIFGNDLFEIWEKELTMPAPSYTIHTVEKLFTEFSADEWYFLIGSDNLPFFSKWHKWAELIHKVKLGVCLRPNYDMNVPEIIPNDRVAFFDGPNWGISSSMIRKRIKENKSCRYLLNENVREFIKKNNLYKSEN
ncbi:MAG: nicotinate-nucleotide adenylyltransferase [Chitinivibrionia bacterium]|nr:nicotinate-nucleotide adenylyltransferase [Chitinivibrionia bacterium]